MQRVKLPWIGHSPSIRIVGVRAFCARAVVLAMLGTLGFAGSAFAADPPDLIPPPEAQQGEGAETGGSTGAGAEQGETAGTGEGSSQEPTEGAGQGSEGSGETLEGGRRTQEVRLLRKNTRKLRLRRKNTRKLRRSSKSSRKPRPQSPDRAKTPKQRSPWPPKKTPSRRAAAQTPKKDLTRPSTPTQRSLKLRSPAPKRQGNRHRPRSAPPTTPPSASGPEAQASATPAAVAGARAAMTAAQRAGDLSCELAALGGSATDNCTAGWLGTKRFLTSPVSFVRAANSLSAQRPACRAAVAVAVAPPRQMHLSPPPLDRRRGALPVPLSAGAHPGGGALSLFLTLAGLLLLEARARCAGCGFRTSRGSRRASC